MLHVQNLSCVYGKRTILDSISFQAKPGEILAILGPNGVGKSTLLKCLSQNLLSYSGDIFLDDINITQYSDRERSKRIAWVPQQVPASSMTVFDAVLLGRRPHIQFNPTEKDLAICAQVIESMDIAPLALQRIDQISGGEFQKVQLCRALAQEPHVLMLDEPSNNLDLSSQYTTLNHVNTIVKSKDVSTIMSVHDINLAIQYADTFVILKEGTIAAYGDRTVITEQLIKSVYGINVDIIYHKDLPIVVPQQK